MDLHSWLDMLGICPHSGNPFLLTLLTACSSCGILCICWAKNFFKNLFRR